MVRFAAYTGLRAGELAGLNVEDVTLASQRSAARLRRRSAHPPQDQGRLGREHAEVGDRERPYLLGVSCAVHLAVPSADGRGQGPPMALLTGNSQCAV